MDERARAPDQPDVAAYKRVPPQKSIVTGIRDRVSGVLMAESTMPTTDYLSLFTHKLYGSVQFFPSSIP